MPRLVLKGDFCAPKPRVRTPVLSLLVLLLSCLALPPVLTRSVGAGGDSTAPEGRQASEKAASGRLLEAYGKLPLAFEANRGQTSGEVEFLSRGNGYALFLTKGEAVLRLRKGEGGDRPNGGAGRDAKEAVLRIAPVGANPSPRMRGLGELPGKSHYFTGGDRSGWRTNVPNYSKVEYESVYPGVDLVFYGERQKLEYDFVVRPGANPSRIKLAFGGARALRVDERGDLVISTGAGDVRQQKPFAYQERGGERVEVPSRYVIDSRRRVGFEVGAYDRALPLVIDPVLLYSTYLGGGDVDQGLGIAVDAAGNAYVTGSTRSTNFPVQGAAQGTKSVGSDAFVAKLNPSGTALLYSTYLGGNGDDIATAIAVDGSGQAHVVGQATATNFPVTAGALQTSKQGGSDGFVTKLSADGSTLLYSTYLGGGSAEQLNGVDVDAAGNAYVVGHTDSTSFGHAGELNAKSGAPLSKSTDGGGLWAESHNGLAAHSVNAIAVDPSNPSTIYAGSSTGVFKSTDGGGTWQLTGGGSPSTAPGFTNAVAIDPTNTNTIYAATNDGILKSTDGGAQYAHKDSGLSVPIVNAIVVDPATPSTLYAGTIFGIFKSTNGGDLWTEVRNGITGSTLRLNEMALDPTAPATVYAGSTRGMFKTTNGGANWTSINTGLSAPGLGLPVTALAVAPSSTSTLYVGGTQGGAGSLFKTTNGGANWAPSSNGLSATINGQTFIPPVNSLVVDPSNASVVYAGTTRGVYKTTDGGQNWAASNGGLKSQNVFAVALNPANASTAYAGANTGADAFVARLNSTGTALGYLRYLGGSDGDEARAVAVDADGKAYVAGHTSSGDFPLANAFQATHGGLNDAFVTKLSADGTTLEYSTYLGGGGGDFGVALAVSPQGNAHVTGSTNSSNFPTAAGALQPTLDGFNDAFVAKLSAGGSTLVYSTYLGGNEFEQGTAVALDSSGNAYVVGETSSPDFPLTLPTQDTYGGGGLDGFITKFNPSGTARLFSTYVGGAGTEEPNGVGLDASDNLYIAGHTNTPDFATANAFQPTHGGNYDAFVSKFGASTELGVTITDAPDPVALGSNLTYTVKVTNNGELTATGVSLVYDLPAGATLVSANSTQGTCTGGGPVTCEIGTLAGGASATATIVITPPAVREIAGTANVSGNEPDPFAPNNTATATTLVNFADVSVTKTALSNVAAPGGRLNYLISVTNHAGATANSVTVADSLPAETTFAACGGAGVTCGGAGNDRTVAFPTLAVGETKTAFISATVGAGVAAGTNVSNTATVSHSFADPNASNNTSTAQATVVAAEAVRARLNGKIAFGDTNSSNDDISSMNADGTGRTKLFGTLESGHERFPVWSPDGTRIALERQSSAGFEIYVINADGTNPRLVASGVGPDIRPTWSPNGALVAFVGQDTSIYVVSPDGGAATRLTPPLGQISGLDWSPDGGRFVFAKSDGTIFTADLGGGDQTQLTATTGTGDGETHDTSPFWSPDGSKVLFTRATVNNHDAYVVNADGTGLSRLLNVRRVRNASWSADGTKVVYNEGFGSELFVAEVDGSGQPVALGKGNDPHWQPLPNPNPTPTPSPAETFTISGKVTRPAGNTSPFTVELTGTRTASITAEADGSYAFVNLPRGGNYTVTPRSIYFVFSPGSRSARNLQDHRADVNFDAAPVFHTIRGRMTDRQGNPVAGVSVSLGSRQSVTNSEGFYAFTGLLPADGTGFFGGYVVQPTSTATLTFEPGAVSLPRLLSDATVNYVGSPTASTRTIGGRLSDNFGTPMRAALVRLDGPGVSRTTKTDGEGNFFFPNLQTGLDYTVTPSTDRGFAFAPPSTAVPSLSAHQFLNLQATTRQPIVNFAATKLSVAEDGGEVELTVTRAGDLTAGGSVEYETADGTGSERSDYTAALGTLHFAPGEESKTFRVPITDDVLLEGNRTFTVTLTNGSGVVGGFDRTATVTITESDAAAGGANPIDDATFFARQHYIDFLGRQPDAAGLAFWSGEITQCGSDAGCIDIKRQNVSAAFFLSIEYQETGYLVYRLHDAAFGTGEALRMRTFLRDQQQLGNGVQVGIGDWVQRLEANKVALVNDLVLRPEFARVYPQTMAPAQFVDALNFNTGGALTQEERDALVADLSGGAKSRAQVLRAVAENAEFSRRELNRAFVLMQYFGYLRRNPNDPPDNDFRGHGFWLTKLNDAQGNFINAQMVQSFLLSFEYRQRFAP